jgi:hydrogenase maturation protease
MTGVSIGIDVRVLGLGNDILADDAFGIRVANEARVRFGSRADVVSSSQAGFHVMDELLGVARLLVVDCIRTGTAKPGTVYVLDEHAVPPASGASSHSLGIFEVLAVARTLGLPAPAECVILAVEAADCTTVGGDMHPDVAAAIPEVLDWIGRFLAL